MNTHTNRRVPPRTVEKAARHAGICKEMNEIYFAKNADYGDSFSETFNKLGLISAITRISDKTNRLQSLCRKEAVVKDETIRDTLLDLANYAIMTAIELDGQKPRCR